MTCTVTCTSGAGIGSTQPYRAEPIPIFSPFAASRIGTVRIRAFGVAVGGRTMDGPVVQRFASDFLPNNDMTISAFALSWFRSESAEKRVPFGPTSPLIDIRQYVFVSIKNDTFGMKG